MIIVVTTVVAAGGTGKEERPGGPHKFTGESRKGLRVRKARLLPSRELSRRCTLSLYRRALLAREFVCKGTVVLVARRMAPFLSLSVGLTPLLFLSSSLLISRSLRLSVSPSHSYPFFPCVYLSPVLSFSCSFSPTVNVPPTTLPSSTSSFPHTGALSLLHYK